MGRRARSETPADRQVNFRLTSAEYAEVSRSAALEGMKVGEYVRWRALSPPETTSRLVAAQNSAFEALSTLATTAARAERPDQISAAVDAAREALAGRKEDG